MFNARVWKSGPVSGLLLGSKIFQIGPKSRFWQLNELLKWDKSSRSEVAKKTKIHLLAQLYKNSIFLSSEYRV